MSAANAKPSHPIRKALWYLNGVMGGHAYVRYLEHERRVHPDREPLTEREFWRQKARDDDANPQARCC